MRVRTPPRPFITSIIKVTEFCSLMYSKHKTSATRKPYSSQDSRILSPQISKRKEKPEERREKRECEERRKNTEERREKKAARRQKGKKREKEEKGQVRS